MNKKLLIGLVVLTMLLVLAFLKADWTIGRSSSDVPAQALDLSVSDTTEPDIAEVEERMESEAEPEYTDIAPEEITYDPIPRLIIFMSPSMEMLITDSAGRRTGYDPVTIAILEEIPDSRYYEEGPIENLETGEIGIPASKQAYLGDLDSGLYELTVFGTETGSYLLEIDSRDSSGQRFIITLDGTTYPGKVDEYLISYSNTAAEDLVVTPVGSLPSTK